MKKVLKTTIFVFTLIMVLSGTVFAALPIDIPREDTLIVDQIFRYGVVNNFNFWAPGAGSQPIRHSLVSDTLWYIDQQTGEWINSLAVERPIYNEDYTEMSVNLREGIYWSDGIEFTADDLVFTIKNLMNNPGMGFALTLIQNVESVEKTGNYSVKFNLKNFNPRFHYNFTARFSALYIMPKHVWEEVKNPMEFNFYPVVSLGAYVQKDADPAGYWELFERRDDWKRTTVGKITDKAGPKYILTIYYGGDAKKVMAMANKELDLIMNLNNESFTALMERDKYARSWYKDFPWAWPDELDTRHFDYNLDIEPYDEKDVRWALTLALNIVDIQTEYIGGTARVTPIPEPATPFLMKAYHKPLETWLKNFEINVTDGEKFKPYDDMVPAKIAEWADKMGYNVPDDPAELEQLFGIGWWKFAPDIAEKLLKKHGLTRNGQGKWLLPDGSLWTIDLLVDPDEVDCYRMALGAQYYWEKFGIKVNLDSLERAALEPKQRAGDFTVQSWFGRPGDANAVDDKWPYIQTLHSDYYKPNGDGSNPGTLFRLNDPKVDKFIEELGSISTDNPKSRELELEYFKYWVENQFFTSTISFKKYVTFSEYYWTNFPTSENPYGQPCYWFIGSRFIFPYLQKTNR